MKTIEACVVRRITIPIDPDGAPGGQTILLVTGDTNLREAAGRALRAAGYRVIPAAHSGHAILAGMSGERIDILIAEIAMDDVSGPRLAERLRRHHPDLQAVYCASAGTPDCEGVLVRPFTRDDLLAQVAATSAGRTRLGRGAR